MGFAVEDRLLILCSQVSISDETKREISSLLQGELDWEYILDASIKHGVAPLFYHGLRQATQAADINALVPGPIVTKLHTLLEGNRARNRRLYTVIKELFGAFEQRAYRRWSERYSVGPRSLSRRRFPPDGRH